MYLPIHSFFIKTYKKTNRIFRNTVRFGAPSGTRTRDTLIKSQVLYQLS